MQQICEGRNLVWIPGDETTSPKCNGSASAPHPPPPQVRDMRKVTPDPGSPRRFVCFAHRCLPQPPVQSCCASRARRDANGRSSLPLHSWYQIQHVLTTCYLRYHDISLGRSCNWTVVSFDPGSHLEYHPVSKPGQLPWGGPQKNAESAKRNGPSTILCSCHAGFFSSPCLWVSLPLCVPALVHLTLLVRMTLCSHALV